VSPIAVNDAVELVEQRGGFFVVQVNGHDPEMVALTVRAESALDAKSVRRELPHELPHELPLRQNGTDALDGVWVLSG
jgi:hypothetical protein